jgi:HEAT repeat protein
MDILHQLRFGSVNERMEAAGIIGRQGNIAAVSALTEALDDLNEGLAIIAARALADIGHPTAREGLRLAYAKYKELYRDQSTHWDDQRLVGIYQSFVRLQGDDEVIQSLIAGDEFERAVAAVTLGRRRTFAARAVLQKALANLGVKTPCNYHLCCHR